MAVTPEVRQLLDMIAAAETVPPSQQSPDQVRQAYWALYALVPKEEVASIADRTLPGPAGDIPIRIYRPIEKPQAAGDSTIPDAGPDVGAAAEPGHGGSGPAPCLIWFHGGGWVIGDLETADGTARSLANGAGVVVVSVDYRLGPEHRFPAAFEDALAAVRWVATNGPELGIDPDRLAVGGDSAGGNLATLACIHLRDTGPPIRFQLLFCPLTDAHFGFPSIDENAEGYMLTKDILLWFRRNYLGDGDRDDLKVSPVWVPDGMLVDLPEALIITAEHDPLRDEAEAYAQRLKSANVQVTLTRYDGMIHNFMTFPTLIPDATQALDEASQALREAVRS
jgi:acetyl esterase